MEGAVLLIIATITSMLFFINGVFLIKRIIGKRDIAFHTIGGAVMLGAIIFTTQGVITMR